MHLFQGHRTSSEPLWHVGLPPLFTQAYIHSLHRFLAHFMICDDYFMISSGFPFFPQCRIMISASYRHALSCCPTSLSPRAKIGSMAVALHCLPAMFGIVQCIHDVWFELQCHLVGTISVGFSPVFGNNLGHPFSRDSFGSLFRNFNPRTCSPS